MFSSLFLRTSFTLSLLLISFFFIYLSINKKTKQRKIALGIMCLLCSSPLVYLVTFTQTEFIPSDFNLGRAFVFTWILTVCSLFLAMILSVISIVTRRMNK